MATIRKRQTKNGVTYDIQVKFKVRGSGEEILKTTTWRPDKPMTDKQSAKEAESFAANFERKIKNMSEGASGIIENPNITFREFSERWLERILLLAQKDSTYSLNYYVKCNESLIEANKHIGGYKFVDITPAILQHYYDELDARKKTVVKITPKPSFRETLTFYGYNYHKLRYEKNVQSCTLANALQGKSVSKGWAVTLCKKTEISFNELFDEVITEEPYAYETMNQVKRTIRAIFSQAKKNRLIDHNYASAEYIDFPPKPDNEIVCMDDEEANLFFNALFDCEDIRVRTSLLTFILTGLRRGEVSGLQWKFIDLEKHTITVNRTVTTIKGFGKVIKKPKTKSSKRVFSIPNSLVEALKEYKVWWQEQVEIMGDILPENIDWLFFQNNGNVVYPGVFNGWLNNVLNAAGIEHYTPHSLRHTNITMQLAAGVPLVTVAGRVGHARPSTTNDKYGHFIKSSDMFAAEILDNKFTRKTD